MGRREHRSQPPQRQGADDADRCTGHELRLSSVLRRVAYHTGDDPSCPSRPVLLTSARAKVKRPHRIWTAAERVAGQLRLVNKTSKRPRATVPPQPTKSNRTTGDSNGG